MSYSFELLALSVLIYVVGGTVSLFFSKQEKLAIYIAGFSGVVGGVCGIIAALPVLLSGHAETYAMWSVFSFADCVFLLDRLAAFMVFVISLLAIASCLYSFSYSQEYIGKGAWAMGFFMNFFIAAMIVLMVTDNAFYFIVFFEVMSLASYFLVISEQDEKAVDAGLLYFFIAHAGSLLIMIAFFLMYREAGSFNFAAFRDVKLSPVMSSIVFLLAFFGFGAKAGMVPLHGWLPKAHPAAPSHASSMMSGVMVKVGIFGIIKVGVDLLGATELWWGIVVLAFGAVSAVLGVLYALAEHDIKRLLAYHTVENVGIILMGVGVGMVGISIHSPILAVVGFLGALYHLINHAVFKGLLFLGAGAIIFRVHTKDMEKMGGLAKVMPITAVCFLIGCMAISALPPLNGFVSEWYTYQSLFSMSQIDSFVLRLAGPIAIVMLAITGALAVMCFVKVFGLSFCGKARSEHAEHAKEVPPSMTSSMIALAVLCVVLGAGAPLVVPIISGIATDLVNGHVVTNSITTVQGMTLVAGNAEQAELSPALMFILLVALTILPLLIVLATKSRRLPFRHQGDPWACGYEYEANMAQSAGSFTQPLRYMFSSLYKIRKTLAIGQYAQNAIKSTTAFAKRIEPWWDEKIVNNVVVATQTIGRWIQKIQQGDYRIYCLYIIAALVILLFVTVLVGGKY